MTYITITTDIFDPEKYMVRDPFGRGWEGEAVIAKIKPEKEKPIGIECGCMMGYVTEDVFAEGVELHPKYDGIVSGVPSGEPTDFVPDVVDMTTEELFNTDYCHICNSVLDHHHHVSYNPEEVIPVCQQCHMRVENEKGYRERLKCSGSRPDGYESEFKVLFKQYRLFVDDVALFQVEGGFDLKNPPLKRNGSKERLEEIGLLAGDLND